MAAFALGRRFRPRLPGLGSAGAKAARLAAPLSKISTISVEN
jgi:hypothetical protein